MILNPWLNLSLLFLAVWLILWALNPDLRPKMLLVSLCTVPFGLTEPLFVPEYWNPPSLFNLAARTGFDIESLIFCFAIGGVASVSYDALVGVSHRKISKAERRGKRHSFHTLAFASPVLVFTALAFTSLNPIYSAIIAMAFGGVATVVCRPDLKRTVGLGGLLFMAIYFVFFLIFDLAYPGLVQQIWNLSAISRILLLGVPLEELMFAFTFGMVWSSVYEHAMWYTVEE